ncbi:MAG: GrrA/OscA1 family cyclophane-containing rSAM-modified RiPP, partial [Snowella sp.]
MNITTRTSLVGFLLAVSALSLPAAAANSPTPDTEATAPTIESRLSRLTQAIRERTQQLPETSDLTSEEIAFGWADGRGGRRGWVN